jgi:transglutaminase-like putative cysteine protease
VTARFYIPLLLTVSCLAPLASPRAEAPAKVALDPALPYQARRSDPVSYDVEFVATVTAPYHTKKLRVWLPLPQSDVGQEVREGEMSTFPVRVEPRVGTEGVFGNRFAYFEFDKPEGAQVIRHTFKIKVWELNWDVDPAKVVRVSSWPASFEPYLRSDRAVTVDSRVKSLARELAPAQRNPADELAAIMDWLNGHMKYDHARAFLLASSEHALSEQAGNCSDYHSLCAALGRALGFPTRMIYGLHAFPKNSPSHCKLEAYLPPYGWVNFDVSETQKLLGAIRSAKDLTAEQKAELTRAAIARLRHGFRDNTYFAQTRGTEYDLVPPAASGKVNVVRTLYAEADGVALPDPDPANPEKKEFAWMTAHKFTPDRVVEYPFKSWKTLEAAKE